MPPALTRQQMVEARAIFDAFDKDGNGTISRSELHSGLAKMAGGEAQPREAVDAMLMLFDQDGDSGLDFAEFCIFYISM